ncbi:MAG: hypothetical protein HQK49_00770 [Oligoflexia bacterium]|nr:hypothetical protein [Oligoflexia bacterium]
MNKKNKLAILGFGNQGKAWALNLRDSGVDFTILLKKNSPSCGKARKLGFKKICSLENEGLEHLSEFTHIVMLTPDNTHFEILTKYKEQFNQNATFIYAHGFSFNRYQLRYINENWTHLLLAPKAIASELRFQYEVKGGLAAVYSVENSENNSENNSNNKSANDDRQFLFDLAKKLGINSGPYQTTFYKECVADLFSEQSILCSVLPYLSELCFNLLRARGIEREVAYLECWYEVKLIVDTLIKVGPHDFFKLISPNALIGGEKGKNILLDDHFKQNLSTIILEDILSGKFEQEIDNTNENELRKRIDDYWKSSELNQVHQQMKPLLFRLD